MLLLNTLPVFAQTSGITDVIPIGGEWLSIFRPKQPFDNLQAACEFQFDIVEKQTNPIPACRIRRLSGKNTYIPFPNGMGGLGNCSVEEPKTELKKIDGKYTLVCTGFIELPGSQILIPYKAPTCPVEPLKPITDPETLRFENGDTLREDLLAPSMKTKLACLKDAVSKAGGKLTPKSAWRPIGYQEHFYEIFTKFKALQREENKKIDACKPILKSITYEKNTKHGIQGNVAPPSTSLHEKGLAFDATWEKITTAKVDALAATCGLNRPLKVTDRVHFQ
jgi:D-alanyl-D-alanine carboxypeptidase